MKTENYGGRSKKIYMIVLFAMIIVLSVFKIIYIRREYLYLATDYRVYILIFMPFVIFYALKHTGNISGAISLNWLCTIPMSMYLYQSMYLRFKQFDILLVYSLMGIMMNIIIVFVLIVGILAILFYINYKRDNEAALIATAIIIMQSICFLLVNLGILRCSVYEVPLLKENTIYSICQLLLLVIALDSKGIVLHQFMKFCKIQKKIKIY